MAEDGYFPPPQDRGGWRTLTRADDIRRNTSMLAERLDELRTWAETRLGGAANAGVVIRHGWRRDVTLSAKECRGWESSTLP